MDYLILIGIGIVMGLFGGLLGIGGSVIMIPAMAMFFKGNQHLYQAAAMICNFFVGATAAFVHKKAKLMIADVVKWLIPAAVFGVLAGVWLSNVEIFAGDNSRNLTRVFGFFLIYVAVYNIYKFKKRSDEHESVDIPTGKKLSVFSLLSGLLTGLGGGFLGIGGGVICTPMQQLCMKMPLKRAISNTSALIAAMALVGAFYKNITLPKHGLETIESIRIAVFIVPSAMVGAFFGGRLMHRLKTRTVRAVFVGLLVVASIKMLTI